MYKVHCIKYIINIHVPRLGGVNVHRLDLVLMPKRTQNEQVNK